MIQEVTEISFLIFLILIVWFNTNAFIEYTYVFNLQKLVKAQEYLDFNIDNQTSLHYTHFLRLNYDNFLIRLITCPICLGVWLNLFSLFFNKNFIVFIYSSSLSLFLFYIFSLIYKKTNASD